MKNKFLIIFLSSLLLVTEMTGTVMAATEHQTEFENFRSGTDVGKTEEENYQRISISSEKDLMDVAEQCQMDSWSADKFLNLEKDIELKEYTEIMIPSFAGIFEGNGHKIKNLKITTEGSSLGLFRYLQKNGEIRNLVVEAEILPEGSRNNIGGIAGTNYGNIFHCRFTGTIKADNRVGGIVGENKESGIIRSSTSYGVIIGNHSTGGIAGENEGSISHCSNYADINTYSEEVAYEMGDFDLENLEKLQSTEKVEAHIDSGGIAGLSTGKIFYSINSGNVGYSHVGYNTGGITGRLKQGYIQNCTNRGKIYGRKDVGGIAGQMEPFIELEYFVDQLQLLDSEVGRLFDLIDESHHTFQDISNQISDVSKNISGYMKDLQSAQTELSNAGTELWNVYNNEMQLVKDNLKKKEEEWENEKNNIQWPEVNWPDFGQDGDQNQDTSSDSGPGSDSDSGLDSESDSGSGSDSDTGSDSDSTSGTEGTDSGSSGSGSESGSSGSDSGGSDSNGSDESSNPNSNQDSNGDDGDSAMGRFVGQASLLADSHKDSSKNPMPNLKEDISEVRKDTVKHLENLQNSSEGPQNAIKNNLDYMNQSMENVGNGVEQLIDIFKTSSDSTGQNVDSIIKQAEVIQNRMSQIRKDLFAYEGPTLEDDSLEDEFMGATNPGMTEEQILDSTDQKFATDSFQLGKITVCENQGSIEADTNVGGIVGQISTEYDFDPEDDISSKGEKSLNIEKTVKAIVRESRNVADVTAKKDFAGGIVGRAEHGAILFCESYGDIESQNGDYVGGLAGLNKNIIHSSYSMGKCSGNSYVGGIVGKGCHLYNSYSYNEIEADGEGIGAIAGKIMEDGVLWENYYVKSSIGAVDGISYENAATPLSYEEFCKRKEVPASFKDFTIRFLLDGKEIASFKRAYGEAISESEIPSIPEKEEYYAKWPDYDFAHIKGNKVLEAQYEKWISTLSSKETKDEKAIILVEGNFYPGMELFVEELEKGAKIRIENPETKECYKDKITVHYLYDDDKNVSVVLPDQSKLTDQNIERKGSYLVFEMDEPAEFYVEENIFTADMIRKIVGIGAAVLVVMILMIYYIKKKNRGKRKDIKSEEGKLEESKLELSKSEESKSKENM